ncbi:TlpA family protein disulfide reductase [Sedimenticola hydrogenitrophicus]|uniref:TlpA family protein disulfide reductase n=1 Tax=Sedimenticola hydrogenitrophicus TaxID=2967975 RepID=UPI0021A806C4|nr:TlpA disulfide reductase family protein [Sedimenticola hydrogenitrophicus]
MTIRSLPGSLLLPALLLMTLGLLAGCEQEPAKPKLTGNAESRLPAFSFANLEGEQQASSQWNGKVLVINYWATWCPPCRKEMPLFIETQQAYADRGVQFVGIAIDDPLMVQDFVDIYAINFPILIGNADAIRLSNRMGNRFDSLPFTAIFDRQGNTRYIQVGEVSREVLERELEPLL